MLIVVTVLESNRRFVTSDYLLRWSDKVAVHARAVTPVEADFLLTDPVTVPAALLGPEPQAWAPDEGLWWPVTVEGRPDQFRT